MRRVFHYADPLQKALISFRNAGYFAGSPLSPLRPILIQVTINDLIRKGSGSELTLKQHIASLVIWVTVLQIGLLLLETLSRFYFSFITAWLGQTVVKDLRISTVYQKVTLT